MTAQEILNTIRNQENHDYWYGLRTCNVSAKPGDTLPVSVNWDASNADDDGDYSKEEYQLLGSSAVSLGDWLYCAEELTDDMVQARMDLSANYPGSDWYLVRGIMIERGSDDYEVILSSNGGGQGAEVIAVL